jgi:hypothetical protein
MACAWEAIEAEHERRVKQQQMTAEREQRVRSDSRRSGCATS